MIFLLGNQTAFVSLIISVHLFDTIFDIIILDKNTANNAKPLEIVFKVYLNTKCGNYD